MKFARISTLAFLAAIGPPPVLFAQVPIPGASHQQIVLRTSDGTSFTLSSSAVRVDGEPCVPLVDLAKALHGTAALLPSLALEGTTLRAVGPHEAETQRPSPAPRLLGVRQRGVVSNRVRVVKDSRGQRLTCVPAADLARSLGGTLKGGTSIEDFDSQINNMMSNNLFFLAAQTKVQNVSQTTQMVSNIAKADSDAKLNAVRNMRTALFEETESALDLVTADQVAWARSFASRRQYRSGRAEIDAAIGAAFPDATREEKIKIHMILLQIMMGDVIGALRSYTILTDQDMRGYARLIVEELDRVQQARSQVIRNFARTKPPRAHAGQNPQATARAQDKSARYTQFVQMSTQLMNELQNTERELMDALQTMHRDMESLWETYAGFRDQEFRTNERIKRP